MLYLISAIIFASVYMFIYGCLKILNEDKLEIENRVNQIKSIQSHKYDSDSRTTILQGLLIPLQGLLSQMLIKITPKQRLLSFYKKLEKAGLLKSYNKEKWLYVKGMLGITIFILMFLIAYIANANLIKSVIFGLLLAITTGPFFNFYLAKRIKGRQLKILKDLPYTLDLITVSVEAGLSFDGAISKVVSNIKGELCDEFAKCLKEIRMGIERKIALKNMSERCEVNELSVFITSIIQADELGVSLGRILRIESDNLREHRKQAARERAMKAPIKMLFPLIFFIFPSVFIIILGPVVIQLINLFTSGV